MNKKEQYIFRNYIAQGFSREEAFKRMKTQIAKEGQPKTTPHGVKPNYEEGGQHDH